MPKKNTNIRTTTNCGLFSLCPSPDGKAWKWFRFNTRKDRGGRKDIATIAKKAGFDVVGSITNLGLARLYVETAIEKGLVALPGQEGKESGSLILRDFVKKMMNPNGDLYIWLQGDPETKIGLRRFGSYVSSFKLHGYNALPETLKLIDTRQEDIERYIRKIRSTGVSDDVVNNCLQAVRKSCRYAVQELKAIKNDPTEGIKVTYKSNSRRDLLRPYELRELLSVLEQHAQEKSTTRTYAKSIFVAVKLMIHTGMREGEVRALRISKIKRLLSDRKEQTRIFRITVDSSWDDTTKTIKSTKSEKPRDIYVWEDLAQLLIDLYNDTKSPQGFVFCCLTNPSVPFTKNSFTDYVYPALREIGISDEQRKERKINIHSFRHYFTTHMEALTSCQWHKEIMVTTGHDTESAHSNYIQDDFLIAYCMAKLSRDLLNEDMYREIYKDAIIE